MKYRLYCEIVESICNEEFIDGAIKFIAIYEDVKRIIPEERLMNHPYSEYAFSTIELETIPPQMLQLYRMYQYNCEYEMCLHFPQIKLNTAFFTLFIDEGFCDQLRKGPHEGVTSPKTIFVKFYQTLQAIIPPSEDILHV